MDPEFTSGPFLFSGSIRRLRLSWGIQGQLKERGRTGIEIGERNPKLGFCSFARNDLPDLHFQA